ncbi:helix-turn-helix domain-containing protein [Pseudomonas monteilii]|uniref:helix-turn-helix domain-containing protein n=1 Tax=Pseudomonas monteilii TaxID=76759 RepID=UPI001CBBFE12|nr:helix-turn-helix domain-containing protein [Pseudomonas monteilii]MBZ3664478.1 helix-turn-helix domain-containing protein [Pseudomonas monteilii]MBZ3670064.1 helix-turn-helix domain-containing protein [Pseudomonas monteilii]
MKQDETDSILLSKSEFEALDARIRANADRWLEDNTPKNKSKVKRKAKINRGPKPRVVENPFYGFIGCATRWGRYPVFALDVIEGIARLDWHSRGIGATGKSMPLSVCNLTVILESLPIITNEAVEDLLQLGERHARRYFKAIELIVPWMMKSRPQSLINEMDGIDPEPKPCDWQDFNEACTPNAEELAKLHHDLRTLTEYKAAEEYEWDYPTCQTTATIVAFPACHQRRHPKKQAVMRMLAQDQAVKAIERLTGVSAKTIRKWRDEVQTVQDRLQVA